MVPSAGNKKRNRAERFCFIRQAFVYPDGELSVRREVETLIEAGFESHIICLNAQTGEKFAPEEVINGVHVHRIPIVRKKTSVLRYLYEYLTFFVLAALKVTRLHLRHPFNVIQVNTMPDFLVFAAFIPKMLGAKLVVMMQEPVPELWQTLYNRRPPRLLKMVEQAALGFADASLTVTQQLKEVYVSRGATPDKISVILNVPEERFLTSDGSAHGNATETDQFTLICHGAIEKRYGHDTILKGIALVKSQIPGIRLRILGRGSYGNELIRQIDKLHLKEHVEYLGWVSLPRMLQELNTADIGIVAQESSPYSNLVHTNKMYEYIALGKPVIATRLNSLYAYFGEDAICYFEPGNPESLAAAILGLYLCPRKRQILVENARKLYGEYKWEKQKEIYLSVYHRLLGQADSG